LSAPQSWACIGRALDPALGDALGDSDGVNTEGEIPIVFLTENQRIRQREMRKGHCWAWYWAQR
jgi:hypothetical protein